MLAAVAETDEVLGSDDAGWPSPYGMSPGLAGAPRATPDYARKTWKAYHERQALLAGRRQLSRPVEVDPVVWGDLIGRKLAELIEGERNHPRCVVRGGAADRDGEHCLLPGARMCLVCLACFGVVVVVVVVVVWLIVARPDVH